LLNNLNLSLILKTWRIWGAPNNACKWQTDLIWRLKVNAGKINNKNALTVLSFQIKTGSNIIKVLLPTDAH